MTTKKNGSKSASKTKNRLIFTLTDFYACIVLGVCYFALDVIYPLCQFTMGIQLSDWWLAANVAIALIELVCLAVIKVNKLGGPAKQETKQMIGILTQVVGAMAGVSIQLPSMTSGERGTPYSPREDGDTDTSADALGDEVFDEPQDGEPYVADELDGDALSPFGEELAEEE